MHQLGIGTMHNMNSIFMDIFMPGWTCKAYTFKFQNSAHSPLYEEPAKFLEIIEKDILNSTTQLSDKL